MGLFLAPGILLNILLDPEDEIYVILGALEGVGGPRQPVHTAVTVQAPGEAAVRTAAHLDRQVANPLHHPAEEAVGGLGGDGIDPLRLDPRDAGQEKEICEASHTRHGDEYKKRSVSLSRDKSYLLVTLSCLMYTALLSNKCWRKINSISHYGLR